MAIATTSAFTAASLAEDGVQMRYFDGVCDETLADTVACITQVATRTMELLDRCMVDEILEKSRRRSPSAEAGRGEEGETDLLAQDPS